MWNALKLIRMWQEKPAADISAEAYQASGQAWPDQWFRCRLNEARMEVDQLMKQFRLSEALKVLYSLVWDDFCSWYLEWIKPGFDEPVNSYHLQQAIAFFEELLQLLHPYMPFITEEIYHHLKKRTAGDDLCIKQFSTITEDLIINDKPGAGYLKEGKLLQELITGIRDARNKAQIKPKESIVLHINSSSAQLIAGIQHLLAKQVNAKEIRFVQSPVPNTITAVIGKDQFYIETEQPLQSGHQKGELQKELEYLKGFLLSVEKKLSNEKFMQQAKPDIVANELRKKEDALSKIKVIEASLANL